MTTHDDNAELLALGEVPARDHEREVDDDPDVRTVSTLVAIATADVAGQPPLSELSRRRVWAKLEGRIAAAGLAQEHALRTVAGAADPAASAANSGPGWRSVIAGLAVAAVLILPRLSSSPEPAVDRSPQAREAAQAQGELAREMVSALGDQGEARARGLASSYAARLSAGEGGERP